jgi:hypothetical protein
MQQFFGLIDTLLASNSASRQRRLHLRTYRVVPCSPLVGVLEWVGGTVPLTEFLIGTSSNHYNGGLSARCVGGCAGGRVVPAPLVDAAAVPAAANARLLLCGGVCCHGAACRYRTPSSLTWMECRSMMHKAAVNTPEKLPAVFEEVRRQQARACSAPVC